MHCRDESKRFVSVDMGRLVSQCRRGYAASVAFIIFQNVIYLLIKWYEESLTFIIWDLLWYKILIYSG